MNSISPSPENFSAMALGHRVYRWEGYVFNFLCAVYFVTFAPGVVDAASTAMRDPEKTVVWLGVLIALISIAEIYAFPVKMRFVREAVKEQGDTLGAGFFLWMFHAVISVILVFLIAGAFGVPIGSEEEGMPGWLAGIITVVVIKELVFLGCLMWDKEEEGKREVNPKYVRPKFREWVVDGILVAYACIAYSTTWGAITTGLSMEKDNTPMFVVNIVVSSILFLIFYLPLRIPYWLEELAQVETKLDAWKLVGSVLLVMVPAIARLG